MSIAWAILDECAEAGIVFRANGGMLRPLLTKGTPPPGLLERVKRHKDGLVEIFDTLRAFCDEFEATGDTPPVGSSENYLDGNRPSDKVPLIN